MKKASIDIKALRHAEAPLTDYYPFRLLLRAGDYIVWRNADHVNLSLAATRFMKSKAGFPVEIEIRANAVYVARRLAKWSERKKRQGFGLPTA